MTIWITILGMALVTFAVRAAPLVRLGSAPSPRVERWLRYVPPAIFAALIVPGLAAPNGVLAAGPELWAGIVGALVAFRTRNIALTIVAGLLAFALVRVLGIGA